MTIEQHVWGFTEAGEAVIVYRMTGASGASIALCNLGAAIVSAVVPDRAGELKDVALGYADWQGYLHDGPWMGKTIGRYANRLARGRFTLDGAEYRLSQNNPPNTLHGGVNGFGNRLWTGRVETDRVVFGLLSPDGEEGFPGELGVEVIYDWGDDNALEITYFAKGDAPTIVSLTNHAYFNLAGEASGSVLDHTLQLAASRWLPTDASQIPTGAIAPVAGTPMDFRTPKPLGRDIDADFEALRIAHGYDHCWLVDGFSREGSLAQRLREVAVLRDPASGRTLEVCSTQPAVQIYTGNFLQGAPRGKSGMDYADRSGVAIECQGCPDAPSRPEFPSQRLERGAIYNEQIIYRFSNG